jgi:hypothetical protein
MELTINETKGLVNLIEFRTKEKAKLLFENDFGMIKGSKLLFFPTLLTCNINEVESMELIENKVKYSPIPYFVIMTIAFLYLGLNIGLLLSGLMLVLLFLFSKTPKDYFLHIQFRNETVTIRVEKSVLNEVTSFIKAYYKYKNE